VVTAGAPVLGAVLVVGAGRWSAAAAVSGDRARWRRCVSGGAVAVESSERDRVREERGRWPGRRARRRVREREAAAAAGERMSE
jgi:hypothetical protein